MVEEILAHNCLNVGMHRPNFASALSNYVLQNQLQRVWKIPKFIKFEGDTNDSTIEHVARYQSDMGYLANNENLNVKFFPNSFSRVTSTSIKAL